VREIVNSAREGGASLTILSGFVAGNFSAYWLGAAILGLMSIAYGVSTLGLASLMVAPAVFAFGLVAFGFLGMGPVTIAVDSYGPVTDNAQSVFELSTIETLPGIAPRSSAISDSSRTSRGQGEPGRERRRRQYLQGDFQAGADRHRGGGRHYHDLLHHRGAHQRLTTNLANLSILYPPFLLGLIAGGAVIYWFTGASTQAVSTGAYRAVEFIKEHIKLESAEKASVADSKKVVAICTQYAQKGMLNIFIAVFFATLAFAFFEPFYFIGYLISIAIFGLFQAIFMANAGGAWDNAKKIVETELKMKGTELHAATVVGDTVGDPFKDTSSVALNPIIKFTTLFGLLAVELAVSLNNKQGNTLSTVLGAVLPDCLGDVRLSQLLQYAD
jgi:K(+)-stimulated pyrophosphate-energized sodium pump